MIPAKSLVFLIDDDASVRKGVARLLPSARYKSETFESASDFLTHAPHPGPSCVIVDVRMPGLNGIDLQKALIPAPQRGTTRFYYRSWRHLAVRPSDESRRGRFSPEAIWRWRIVAMRRARPCPIGRTAPAQRGKRCSPSAS